MRNSTTYLIDRNNYQDPISFQKDYNKLFWKIYAQGWDPIICVLNSTAISTQENKVDNEWKGER